jgi:hypothetical protein
MTTLNIFAQQMNALANAIQRNAPILQREVSQAVVDYVATSTPVLTGQASGNWKTAIGTPDTSWDPGASSPQHSIAEAHATLRGLAIGQTVYITNNVPYIVDLNQGSSSKAPAGFVEASVVNALHITANFNLLIR